MNVLTKYTNIEQLVANSIIFANNAKQNTLQNHSKMNPTFLIEIQTTQSTQTQYFIDLDSVTSIWNKIYPLPPDISKSPNIQYFFQALECMHFPSKVL